MFKSVLFFIEQLKVLDSERIAELGNTLSTNTNKQELDAGGHTRTKKHTLSCDAGDLISSVNLTLPDSSPSMQHRGDFSKYVSRSILHFGTEIWNGIFRSLIPDFL